jgi:hypothetical protein
MCGISLVTRRCTAVRCHRVRPFIVRLLTLTHRHRALPACRRTEALIDPICYEDHATHRARFPVFCPPSIHTLIVAQASHRRSAGGHTGVAQVSRTHAEQFLRGKKPNPRQPNPLMSLRCTHAGPQDTHMSPARPGGFTKCSHWTCHPP